MYQQRLMIRFVIIKAKKNSKGLCPLSCRLTFQKTRKVFSTGLFVSPKDWDAKKQIVHQKTNVDINAQLELISSELRKAHLSLQLNNEPYNVETIYKKYKGEPTSQNIGTVLYIKGFLAKQKKLIGKDLELGTWKKYNYSCKQLESFIKWKFQKRDILLGELKLQFLADFEFYLKTEMEQAQVTVNKTIQRFRKPIREACNEDYLEKDPFVLFKPGKVRKKVVFLSVEELKILEDFNFIQPRLELVKDLFVFCCYTGLAYNEMSSLKKDHIVKGFDNNEWIQMTRKKTNKLISVPLLPKAKAILDKYHDTRDYALPKFSNQKINSYLKEIGAIVGIDKNITHHVARKTFASTVLLYNDVPMEIVSELLGHSSMKITQEYYGKVVQRKVGKEMERLKSKLPLK